MGEPFWHLYTDGNQSSIIFTSEADFKVGMNLIAVSAIRHTNVKVYTFTLMNNHVHIIISGNEDKCILFFEEFRSRLQRYFARNGRCVNLNNFTSNIIRITDLKMLRNEIAYVNRNGYSAHSQYTPFSYPWGAGACFYNPFLLCLPSVHYAGLSVREKRKICHSNDVVIPSPDVKVIGGLILPSSFCSIAEAESFFRSAHHYFQHLTKRYEAYSEIASRLHESLFIADEEMYSAVCSQCMKYYGVKNPSHLSAKDRIEMARRMRRDYNASNRQIKAILKLESSIIDELFPD
jgi:REP element-mobilizing transposase RayT